LKKFKGIHLEATSTNDSQTKKSLANQRLGDPLDWKAELSPMTNTIFIGLMFASALPLAICMTAKPKV